MKCVMQEIKFCLSFRLNMHGLNEEMKSWISVEGEKVRQTLLCVGKSWRM